MYKLIALFCIISAQAFGISRPVPARDRSVHYGGKVDNVKDGCYDITFSIYGALDSNWPLWQEVHPKVEIKNGYFSVMLGDVLPIPEDVWDGDVFLEREVDRKCSRQAVVSLGGIEKEDWLSGKLYGTYVGQTAATYNGDLGGYDGANAKCDAEFPGSHLCTVYEILMSIYQGKTIGTGWVAAGVYILDLGDFDPNGFYSDCYGFTDTGPNEDGEDRFSQVWNVDRPGFSICTELHSLLCCK